MAVEEVRGLARKVTGSVARFLGRHVARQFAGRRGSSDTQASRRADTERYRFTRVVCAYRSRPQTLRYRRTDRSAAPLLRGKTHPDERAQEARYGEEIQREFQGEGP